MAADLADEGRAGRKKTGNKSVFFTRASPLHVIRPFHIPFSRDTLQFMNYKKHEKIAFLLLIYLFLIPSIIGSFAALAWNDITIVSIAAVGGLFICLLINILFAACKGKLIIRDSFQISTVTASEAPVSFFINLLLYIFLAAIFGLILFGSLDT